MQNSVGKSERILVIGASILQLPAILKAKDMDLCVGVVDYNRYAVGIPYADEFFNVSTIDEHGVYEAAKAFGADGIVTLATDLPILAVSFACNKLGLKGISYETAVKCTDKAAMIKAFSSWGVEHPWFHVVDSIEMLSTIKSKIQYPCISKPTDNSGSRGVVLVNTEDELKDAVRYSSEHGRKGAVIIEEFMQGNEVSVELMVLNGIPHVLAITDKLTTGGPHFVEMGHSQPSCLGENDVDRIIDLASRAVKAVGIDNGPAHAEIMLTASGPKMIELGARMGGDCITTHLVPLSTGIDMVKATIQLALGQTPDLKVRHSKGAAIRYLGVCGGVIKEVDGIEQAELIKGVKEITILKKVGETVCSITNSTERVGFVVAQGYNAPKK